MDIDNDFIMLQVEDGIVQVGRKLSSYHFSGENFLIPIHFSFHSILEVVLSSWNIMTLV